MELLSFLSIILSLVAIFKVNSLGKKIDSLTNRATSESKPSLQVPSSQAVTSITSETAPEQKQIQSASEKGPIEKFAAWYAHEWPLKTGALFILLGFLWLVTYAFLNNWIGPAGRITFGIISGVLVLLFGERRMQKVKTQGITLIGLGAGIVIITTYAAQEVYQMFPPQLALTFMVLTMMYTSFVSLRYRVLSLAVFSLCIGGIAPLLIGSEEKSIMGLYGYLLAVVISNIWIARYSKWKILSFLSIVLITLYSATFFISSAETLKTILSPKEFLEISFFAVTFCSLFYFSTLASIITSRKASTIDLQTAALVGFFSLAWINALTMPAYKSVVILVATFAYAGGAYLVYLRTKIPSAVQVYTVVSMILLAVATAFEFDGSALTVAFSIEALILPIISSRLLGTTMTKYMLLYHILPVALGINALAGVSGMHFAREFTILLFVTLSTFLSGCYFYYADGKQDRDLHSASILLIIIGAVYGLLLIWRTSNEIIPVTYFARAVSLVIYTLIGLSSYVIAGLQERPVLKKFGLGLLIAVIGRLLVVEIWSMELTGRIITFFLIGLLFIGSVLMGKTKKVL